MSAELPVRREILEPLHRVLRWMASLRDGEGRILCPEHEVEHTGKSAGAIVLAYTLMELDPEADRDFLFDLAVQQGRRLVANLKREGTSPCHTFRPGRHDPYNCSNSVIDGGACSDALTDLVARHADRLDARDRESFQYAGVLHARTYLRYAVVDKGIPAQRAWALTGLAGALALEADERMETAALAGIGELEAIQHQDGSYPYHPLEWGAAHPGASDASAYYQSRVTAFLLFSLAKLGRDPLDATFRTPLERGLEFLCALQGPDGIKCGLVEAKPWYWGATYEVASHPFDVHALAHGARVFGDRRAARCARLAFEAWKAHLSADGVLASHRPGPGRSKSYQCPVFWAGHASWLARAARDLEAAYRLPDDPVTPIPGAGGIDVRASWFPGAQLARLEDDRIVAWVRGRRPAVNVSHGSPHGAGLLRCVRKSDHADLIVRCRLGGHQAGEWSGKAGVFSPARGWRSGRKEVRFSSWIARTHLRAGRTSAALLALPRAFSRGVLAFAHPRVSSAFALDPRCELLPNGIVLHSSLAHRDGSPVEGSSLERIFQVDGDGLEVLERMHTPGSARSLQYRVPPAAVSSEERDRSGTREIRFRLA